MSSDTLFDQKFIDTQLGDQFGVHLGAFLEDHLQWSRGVL